MDTDSKNFLIRHLKHFGVLYGIACVGLSYFAIYPVWQNGDWQTLMTTVFQTLVLAAVVAPYAFAVFLFDDEEEQQVVER